jgi:hypothetical protein
LDKNRRRGQKRSASIQPQRVEIITAGNERALGIFRAEFCARGPQATKGFKILRNITFPWQGGNNWQKAERKPKGSHGTKKEDVFVAVMIQGG